MLQRCCTERAAKRSSTSTHLASQAYEVIAGGQHEPFNAYDLSSDPLAAKLELFLQADLNQRKESDKCTFPAACGQRIERSATAATLAASGSFPIATRHRESSASALQDFVTWLAK